MVGEHDHDGIRHLFLRQPHSGTFHLPDWMAAPQAGSAAIIAAPRLPLTHLLELRALVDHLVASLPRDSIFGGGHADEEFAPAVPPAKMSSEERVKAVMHTPQLEGLGEVLIRGHHEAYISWEEFERNQHLIADNANGKSYLGRGVRHGEALLPE
ncbi:recombinase family protein [Mesorhizobium sp. M0239]